MQSSFGWTHEEERNCKGRVISSEVITLLTEWTFFRGLEAASVDIASKIWWAKIEYLPFHPR